MALARSKVTSQGQISVPAEVRKKLGIGPGSVIEWNEEGEKIVVRRSGKYSSEDIHKILFPNGPPKRASIEDMKEAIRRHIRERQARADAGR
jgi:AbrB family looped-hinge helix DNA binding protein